MMFYYTAMYRCMLACFLWSKWSVLELQESFHRGGTIKDITDQICSLNANLHSYDSPTQLVVDKYMKEHGLEVEPDEEEFGYGKLMIDYKLPKKSTSKISDKGKVYLIDSIFYDVIY